VASIDCNALSLSWRVVLEAIIVLGVNGSHFPVALAVPRENFLIAFTAVRKELGERTMRGSTS
jgi:hypothetical protein